MHRLAPRIEFGFNNLNREYLDEMDFSDEEASHPLLDSFHPSFRPVYKKLQKWMDRFPDTFDSSVFHDLLLFFLQNTKKYLDHRNYNHFFRLVLSVHRLQKRLIHEITLYPNRRSLEIRLLPTALVFPFSSRPVLGCLIGFNMLDRNELFDEENILLALNKYLPTLTVVKESVYTHSGQYKDLKTFYLEIQKKDGTCFTFAEQQLLKSKLEDKVKYSIQTLVPLIFARPNQEELYRNIHVLSHEIQSLDDLPQAYITLDQQTGKEIIFCVTLVYISPFHHFSLKDYFNECLFVSEFVSTVRHLDETHPVEAHVFRLHLPRDSSLLRSDASLDFYSARKKVADLIRGAIGEYRDYNGGIIIKQLEILEDVKSAFPDLAIQNPELIETFFYALTPVHKQALVQGKILSDLFTYFLENRNERCPEKSPYAIKVNNRDRLTFVALRGEESSLITTIRAALQETPFKTVDFVYNILDTLEGIFFNCVFLQSDNQNAQACIQLLQSSFDQWCHKMDNRQILRIGLGYSIVSLDPRIGGDNVSGDMLKFLFEGLTRVNQNGQVENGVAESIEVSSNGKKYLFRLKSTLWNDGSQVTAYDFEYAWKKVLSPDFKTAFAYLFYPIKNAKEAKEGKVSLDQVGIQAIDDRTLQIELTAPTPYFLHCTAHIIYSPIHRAIDNQYPQWPYQCEKHYPCNGPFQLRINHSNKGYQLIKNAFYFDANQVALDQVTFIHVTANQALQKFQKKELDWIGNPFGVWDASYGSIKEGQTISFPNTMVCWFVFNTTCPPYNNQKLRQAFAHAIRRDDIVENCQFPLNEAYSILLPHYRKNPHRFFPNYNPELARQLFHEALEELNMTVEDFSPVNFVFYEKGTSEHAAICLRQQFKECFGIEFDLQPCPWNTGFNRLTRGNFQVSLIHWSHRIDDPIYTLDVFKNASEELNFTNWENSEFQRYVDLSQKEGNPFQRSSYLSKAEEILSKEVPIIPLFYRPSQAIVQKDLDFMHLAPGGSHCMERSFFKKQNKGN